MTGNSNKGNKKSGKSSKKIEINCKIDEMLTRTLKEMVVDLAKIDNEKSFELEKFVNDENIKNPSRIASWIRDPNSELCKTIPLEELATNPTGRRYLEILSMAPQPLFQKALKDFKITRKTVLIPDPEVPVAGENEDEGKLTEMMQSLLGPEGQGETLINFAKSTIKETGMDKIDPKTMKPEDLVGTLTKTIEIFERQKNSGELDFAKLEQDAKHVLTNVTSNKVFTNMQNELNNPDNAAGMGNMGEFMKQMESMMKNSGNGSGAGNMNEMLGSMMKNMMNMKK